MATDYDSLVNLRQEGKINDLVFVMESDFNQTFLSWCHENEVEPSEENADTFLRELEYDMFEHQTKIDEYGIFSL